MFHLPLQIGFGNNGAWNPHEILREQGSDCWLVEYVFKGAGWLKTSLPKPQTLTAGDWFAFAPGVRQDYGMNEAWDHGWLCFLPRTEWLELLNWPTIDQGIYHLHMEPGDVREECEVLMMEGVTLSRRHWKRREAVLLNQIERILLRVDTINPRSQAAVLDERIRLVVDYLGAHPEIPISIDELADRCSLSPSRFAHLFREVIGLTPMRYQERLRIRKGRELLLMTAMPISEIAYACGYEDPLYFSRIFKRSMEVSPRAYRQSQHGLK